MNSSKRQETEIEMPEHSRTNEHCNLGPKPAKRVQFALDQTNNQLVISIPKTHMHIMLTQLKIKERLKAFGNKGDKHILKELNNYTQGKYLCHGIKMKCHGIKEKAL